MKRCVALLGRPDTPTDGVEDYCVFLSQALEEQGISLELSRVKWMENGWREALQEVRKKAEERRGAWFLVQYTALAWSRRGFPLRVPRIMQFLKNCGARCVIVFHDAVPYAGSRWIDRLRRRVQVHIMRRALRIADLAVFPVPPERVSWIPDSSKNIAFIPVGANLPAAERAWSMDKNRSDGASTVCVFSVSTGAYRESELERVEAALRFSSQKLGKVRLIVAGRNSEEAGRELRERLAGTAVEVVIHGILPAEEAVCVLGSCDVMLFPKGDISSRRSSAIAGIACGLPMVAPEGSETAAPLTEAGVVLVPAKANNEFGPALVRILSDDAYRESLAARSRRAQERYFSWSAIAAQYAEALRIAEKEIHRD